MTRLEQIEKAAKVLNPFEPVAEYIEAMWKKENELYNMIEQLTEENRKLKETDKK